MNSDQKEFIEEYRALCERYKMYLYFNHKVGSVCIAETSTKDAKEEINYSIYRLITPTI